LLREKRIGRPTAGTVTPDPAKAIGVPKAVASGRVCAFPRDAVPLPLRE
jgi:hypothetical protein